MNGPESSLVIFGVMAVVLVVVAILANIFDTPWVMVLVPIVYIILQVLNRMGRR